MYHKIKSCREKHSIRKCAEQLGVSPTTIVKYAQMSMEEASGYVAKPGRSSQFAAALAYIKEELSAFPKISATKLLRKVKARHLEITGKARAFRAYLAPLRKAAEAEKKIRYYEPVLDMVPGRQVQVDIGEEWVEKAPGGKRFKSYFVSFVFSYSRNQYAHFQGRVYNTESFIKAHIAAFRYFGGVASEYVYDQTKLVVITEKYREVFFNERFYQFALEYGFSPRVCEGYDPESKGKVERNISYIKTDFLYGDCFSDLEDVKKRSLTWLENVANKRIHAATKRIPAEMFLEEASLLKQPTALSQDRQTRWADKTGLISFEGNKYSVPHLYQRKIVWVSKSETQLKIRDNETTEEIAVHNIPAKRGQIIKNINHYRDYRKDVETLTAEAQTLFENLKNGNRLIERIKSDNPKIKRDQLRALGHLYRKYKQAIWQQAMPTFEKLPQLRATLIESILEGFAQKMRLKQVDETSIASDKTSEIDRPVSYYMEAIANA